MAFFRALASVFGNKTNSSSESSYGGMSQFQARLVDIHLGDDGDGPPAKQIEAKGLVPLTRRTRIGFLTSVFDNTSGELEPVYCYIEDFQEPETIAYQHLVDTGEASPDEGFLNWVNLGVVIPDIIQTPFSGNRDIVVMFRMVDLDNMPDIFLGFREKHDSGILWQKSLTFKYNFTDKGYEEAAQDRDEACAISLKVAIAVAMADGSLDDSEGEVIKKWVKRIVDSHKSEKKKEHLKSVYNSAMKEAYHLALKGDLSLSELTSRLNEIAEKSSRYETIDLCNEVMAADGVADVEELKIITKIAEALELDLDEVKKIQDQKIINLSMNVTGQEDIEEILGVDKNWDANKIKKHLRNEFQKWNNRINMLEAGAERENAQKMLDLISEARKNYV